MKLLFCKSCADVVAIDQNITYCKCTRSKSKYTDGVKVIHSGPSEILGIEDRELANILINNVDEKGFCKGVWVKLSPWSSTVTKVRDVVKWKPKVVRRRLTGSAASGNMGSRRSQRSHSNKGV